MRVFSFFIAFLLIISCEKQKDNSIVFRENTSIRYSKHFKIKEYKNVRVLDVGEDSYVLKRKNQDIPLELQNLTTIEIPLKDVVLTSSSFIPHLEALGVESTLKGFPNTKYISSEKTYELVLEGKIAELGSDTQLNLEQLIHLQPDALITFSYGGDREEHRKISKAGIPILYNNDWKESEPLARTEWILFFGALYDKLDLAVSLFNDTEMRYKSLTKKNIDKGKTMISGAVFQGVWYAPSGQSFMSKIFQDAGINYLFSNTTGTGSLSLDPEYVLDTGKNARYWFNPDRYISKEQMYQVNSIYKEFDAMKNSKVFSYGSKTGPNGSLIYFDQSGLHPDWILEDILFWTGQINPKGYKPHFFKPLTE